MRKSSFLCMKLQVTFILLLPLFIIYLWDFHTVKLLLSFWRFLFLDNCWCSHISKTSVVQYKCLLLWMSYRILHLGILHCYQVCICCSLSASVIFLWLSPFHDDWILHWMCSPSPYLFREALEVFRTERKKHPEFFNLFDSRTYELFLWIFIQVLQ